MTDMTTDLLDQVARYWYDLATADPRELVGHFFIPCRFCWGIDHHYQFTNGELRVASRSHLAEQLRLPEAHRVPFDELGGAGYTKNRYPMRGPDWVARMERSYAKLGRPLPEGLEANADHSCPECHGDGDRYLWVCDTRHLSPSAARLYNGVRVTAGNVEMKLRDRSEAMEKFEQLTGMIKPRRPKFSFNLDELNAEELDALLDEARQRGLLSDEELARGRLLDAAAATAPSNQGAPSIRPTSAAALGDDRGFGRRFALRHSG